MKLIIKYGSHEQNHDAITDTSQSLHALHS